MSYITVGGLDFIDITATFGKPLNNNEVSCLYKVYRSTGSRILMDWFLKASRVHGTFNNAKRVFIIY